MEAILPKILKIKAELKGGGRKVIIFDEFPHIPYEIRKYIRKLLPVEKYGLVFVSATPNTLLSELLNPEDSLLDARKKREDYDILAVSITI